MDCSTPGLPVHHQLPELSSLLSPTQTWAGAFRVLAPARIPLQPHLSFLEREFCQDGPLSAVSTPGGPRVLSGLGVQLSDGGCFWLSSCEPEGERMCLCLLFQVSSPVQKPYLTKKPKAKLSFCHLGPLPSLPLPSGLQQVSQRGPPGGVWGQFSLSSSASLAARVSAEEGSRQPGPCLHLGLFQFPHRNSMLCVYWVPRSQPLFDEGLFGKRKAPLIKYYKRKLPTMVITAWERNPQGAETLHWGLDRGIGGVRPVAPPTWLVSNFLVRPASS